jgi:hypothetical protein
LLCIELSIGEGVARSHPSGRTLVTRRLELEPEWLDALETRRYLDPFDRTIAKAEVAALKRFLQDHLGGQHDFAATRRD